GTRMATVALAQYRALQGRFQEATTLQADALRSVELALGKYHPYTCSVLGDLAFTSRDLGQWEEATRLEQDALARLAHSLGESHLHTLKAKVNLASTLSYRGLHDEAEKLQKEADDMLS